MYAKAICRTVFSMSSFYVENVCKWIKMAVWDAPRRVYLDIELEKMKIEREEQTEIERLSRVGSRTYSSE
jgi:hypothetical protein